MEKEKFLERIVECINSSNPQNEVNAFCRNTLLEKVKKTNVKDDCINDILSSLAKQFSISLEYSNVQNNIGTNGIDAKTVSLYGVAGLAGIVSIVSDNYLTRIFACGVVAAASIFATKSRTSIPKLRIKTFPHDVYSKVCQYEKIIGKLAIFNSLDSYDKGILEWMQQQFSESKDDWYKDSIKNILKQSGYEFVYYTKELSDHFESSTANVEVATTTYPAIMSNHSGYIVQKGHVVFPKD